VGGLVRVTRGNGVDAWHRISVAVVDARGRLVACAGDPDLEFMTRSAIKPFQALPLLTSGAARAFELSAAELAIACASHDGTDDHVAVVRGILRKAGVGADALRCGTHWPLGMQAHRQFPLHGEDRDPLRHNCSGKHAGFLLVAQQLGVPQMSYLEPEGPVQQMVKSALADVTGLTPGQLAWGIDGCSAPNFALPLRRLALAFARLCAPNAPQAAALAELRNAMLEHPRLLSGAGQFDADLMEAFAGRVVCKSGAEGVCALGLLDNAIGIAVKVHDGNSRALAPAVLAVLEQLIALTPAQREALAKHYRPRVHNWAGALTGEIHAEIALEDCVQAP
jgi:L-asparaginase II